MKKVLLGAVMSLSLSSASYAASYFCESNEVEVRAEPISNSMNYTLEVTDKASNEVIFMEEAEAYLGTGSDATFNVAGEAILIIDYAAFGDLTFKTVTFGNLDCKVN